MGWARSIASMPMDRCQKTISSSTSRARTRPSGATAIATRRAWHGIRLTGNYGSPGTARLAGMRSIFIHPGLNYGWGVISMGIQPGITEQAHEGMEQPIVHFTPALAPTEIAFYTGSLYPGRKNTSLFVGGLVGQELRRLEISGNQVTHQEVLFSEFGRVRDIVQGPDGYLYVALQNPPGSMACSSPTVHRG
jgi:Glucose / Sorbosone dehydrogenase